MSSANERLAGWTVIRRRVAKPGESFAHMTLLRHEQTGLYRLAAPDGALVGISQRDGERLAKGADEVKTK